MKEKGKTERAKISSLPQGCCGGTKKRDNFFFGRRVFLPTHLPQGRCRTPRQTEEHCFLVFVLVVFSPPPPPPPPMVFVAPAFAVAVAMVCCFRKERERERRGQTTDGRLINNKKCGRERERERERDETRKRAKKCPCFGLIRHKRGRSPRKGHFFESQNCEKNALSSPSNLLPSLFLFDEAKEFEDTKKQKRSVQIFARTHAPRLRAVLRSFLCLFVLVLLSRFFSFC